jgi:hypothetical protein
MVGEFSCNIEQLSVFNKQLSVNSYQLSVNSYQSQFAVSGNRYINFKKSINLKVDAFFVD